MLGRTRFIRTMGRRVAGFAVVAIVAAGAPASHATTTGKTAAGRAFVTGGISLDEREALAAQRSAFDLQVTTAARKSGAYVAGARVTITDRAGTTVLDAAMDGPWLFVDLAPGKYRVVARHDGQTIARETVVRAGAHREVIFYFDVPAQTLPPGEAH